MDCVFTLHGYEAPEGVLGRGAGASGLRNPVGDLDGIRSNITEAIEGYLELLAERVAPGRTAPGGRPASSGSEDRRLTR